jgi:hypothetical protein
MRTDHDPELLAARALLARFDAAYGLPAEGPVPVEEMAGSVCGLLVREREPMSCSGVLLVRERRIEVNAGEVRAWPPRRRFTVAHEVGHWELHAGAGGRDFYCRPADVSEVEDPAARAEETQANRFAAELLMPAERLRRLVRRHGAAPARLAALLDVSEIAMAWRLYNLGLGDVRPEPFAPAPSPAPR